MRGNNQALSAGCSFQPHFDDCSMSEAEALIAVWELWSTSSSLVLSRQFGPVSGLRDSEWCDGYWDQLDANDPTGHFGSSSLGPTVAHISVHWVRSSFVASHILLWTAIICNVSIKHSLIDQRLYPCTKTPDIGRVAGRFQTLNLAAIAGRFLFFMLRDASVVIPYVLIN